MNAPTPTRPIDALQRAVDNALTEYADALGEGDLIIGWHLIADAYPGPSNDAEEGDHAYVRVSAANQPLHVTLGLIDYTRTLVHHRMAEGVRDA
jgi:hypothetical protein